MGEHTLQVFVNKYLRKYFDIRKKKKIKSRILYNKELSDLHTLPGLVMVVKCRRLQWARYVARMDIM
jgi:hypothetical protein